MRIAPGGWPFLAVGWALAALGAWAALRSGWGVWFWGVEAALVALAVWLVVFFRDPERRGPRGDDVVIAPADGRVVAVVVEEEPTFLGTRATRISTFMNVFDVHVNRYPASGRIELLRYNPGKFLHAATEKASLENEQASIGIRTARGPLLVRQIAGVIARRIVTDGKPGDAVEQGARLGMIRFGSRVDVFLPVAGNPAIRVGVGDRVQAGRSVLAEYGR